MEGNKMYNPKNKPKKKKNKKEGNAIKIVWKEFRFIYLFTRIS